MARVLDSIWRIRLARDAKLATDFLERAGMSVDKAKAQLDNLALAIGKRIEHLSELLLQHGEAGGIGRDDSGSPR